MPYDLARPVLDRSQYASLVDCIKTRAATDQKSVEKDKEVEHEGKPSSIDDGDDEMSSEALEAKDVECLALEGQEHCKEIADLTYQSQDLEILEEKNDLSTTLGPVIMLLNNRCMSFKVLLPHFQYQSCLHITCGDSEVSTRALGQVIDISCCQVLCILNIQCPFTNSTS